MIQLVRQEIMIERIVTQITEATLVAEVEAHLLARLDQIVLLMATLVVAEVVGLQQEVQEVVAALAPALGRERRQGRAGALDVEAELVAQFGFSRMTINRALRELTDEGLLVRLQGVGTFVAEPKGQSALFEIRSIADEIAARNHQHHRPSVHRR